MNRLPNNGNASSDAERISLAGQLLVASPSQQDPVFSRSVCIVVEHSPERSVGIMLNRPMLIDTEPLWEQILDGAASHSQSIDHFNFGGPQEGPVLAIHDSAKLAEGGNNQGVYLSAQTENLKKLATAAPEHCRLFIGHALWKPKQLEQQIIQGDWHVMPAIPELVFARESTMWAIGMSIIGNSILKMAPGIVDLPVDPLLN